MECGWQKISLYTLNKWIALQTRKIPKPANYGIFDFCQMCKPWMHSLTMHCFCYNLLDPFNICCCVCYNFQNEKRTAVKHQWNYKDRVKERARKQPAISAIGWLYKVYDTNRLIRLNQWWTILLSIFSLPRQFSHDCFKTVRQAKRFCKYWPIDNSWFFRLYPIIGMCICV